jgi:hypothetical protein
MLKNITILIILLHYTNYLFSQQNFDSELLRLEQKIYNEENDTVKADLILQKINLYFTQNSADGRALNETERCDWTLIKDSAYQSNYLWNLTLLNLLQKRYNRAINYYENYIKIKTNDTTIHTKLLGALIYMNLDSIKLKNYLEQQHFEIALVDNFTCYQKILNVNQKNKNMYLAASAVLPGSGLLALIKPKQGITSLLLNAGVAYTVFELINNNLYFNAVAIGLMLTQKFYLGGIKLTNKLFDEKINHKKAVIAQQCELDLKKLLEQYPLNFKLK